MYIRSIELRNWKGYAHAKLEFPKPGQKKNVVLIGANNGYGKTSLLEAFILCLYGQEGVWTLPRAGSKGEQSQSYNDFLERALHAVARDRGDMSCSVKVVFEKTSDDEEDRIGVERTWRFSGAGKHQPGDEEVQVWHGEDDTPVRVPKSEERERFYRGVIAQQILPCVLVPFFFFDGEQVQKLARQGSDEQVRKGIEGLLGIQVLRRLQEDLREVASACRRETRDTNDELLDQVKADVLRRSELCARKHEELETLRQQHIRTRDERDAHLNEFMLLAGGKDTLNELQERRARYERARDQHGEELRQLLRGDLALALSGTPLRRRLREQLRGELTRLRWEQAKAEGERHRHLERLEEGLRSAEPPLPRPLDEEQWTILRERLQKTWEALHFPPPADCAAEHRHGYLGEDRNIVLRHLERVEQVSLAGLLGLLEHMDEMSSKIRRTTNDIANQSGSREQMAALKERLDQLTQAEAQLYARVGILEKELAHEEKELHNARGNLARMEEQHQTSLPSRRRAEVGEKIIALIEELVPACYRRHHEQLNAAMNEAYLAMAHKGAVKRIEVSDSAEVRLLNEKGSDLRAQDLSAGEDQIFSLALIAALARISKRDIPVIMDTPLARLDSNHRRNVLEYFTNRKGEQVILLSQPEEINREYLAQIDSRIGVKYLLNHKRLPGGMGLNEVVRDRYFF